MNLKQQIIDPETQTHIDVQSTQANLNSNIFTSVNTSLSNIQNSQIPHHPYEDQTRQHQIDQENQSGTEDQKNPTTIEYEHLESYAQTFIPEVNQSQKPCFDLQKFAYALESIQYSLIRIFYRSFHNKLISFYIQSLKEEQRKERQTKQIEIKLLKEQNWPFKELFYKKYRNENEQIMFEFINLCAEKIQSTFKAYIIHKRHKQAMKKIETFKTKLGAVVIGWKTWNIYNCKKIKEIRKNSMNISNQIGLEIQNPNLDRFKKMKKIEYLNSSHQVVKQNFKNSFKHLLDSGAWIYEVDKCFKKPVNKGPINRVIHSYQPHVQSIGQDLNEIRHDRHDESVTPTIQQKHKTRKRQFQGGLSRNAIKQSVQSKPISSYEDQPIKAKGSYQNASMTQKNISSSGLQQRPIVAKGKYELTQEDIANNQNQFLKLNQHQKNNQNPNQIKDEQPSPRINKFKDDEKKKLIKRQKYDPRKAIEEEKIRLQDQKKKKLQNQKQETQNLSQIVTTDLKKKPEKKVNEVSKKTPRVIKKQPLRREFQSPKQSSKEKTVEKVKKQSHLTKKGDNSKSIKLIVNNKKVESKVDCWGPKKDSPQTQIPSTQELSYKSKYLGSLKERNETKMAENSSYKQSDASRRQIRQQKQISIHEDEFIGAKEEKITNKLKRKNTETDEEETFQSSYLKKLVEQKEKGSFSYGTSRIPGQRKYIEKANDRSEEDSYAQKFEQLSNNIKRLSQNRSSKTNLKNPSQQERKISIHQSNEVQNQPQKKKQEMHRSIESLEDVYSTQYTDRLNTLKNKLNMLESTRYIQRDDSIPIILEESKFVKKMYKDHAFSSLYWPQVRTMETNFLDYIKFSGF